jgi:two-component system, CAI-1 autoinducer sensor kinase/phosphatase CqsS
VPLDRLWFHSARIRLWRWMQEEIVLAPLEPILHASATRLRFAGISIFVGNLIFYWIWTAVVRQPYESFPLRLATGGLGLLFFSSFMTRDSNTRQSTWTFSLVCWLTMPVYFFWMYWMNGGNPVWLASVCAMVLIYYHMTDWRLATIGVLTGAVVSGLLFDTLTPDRSAIASISPENLYSIGFSWGAAFLLGFSGANLRRARLLNTLSTMAVMAHELRTPLATVNLMGDVLQTLAQNDVPDGKKKKLDELATRLQSLVRSMNRQIDTQISNAQLLRLPRDQSPVLAAALVHDVVNSYPYRSSRERDCVRVTIQQDFCFVASPQLFSQVLTNLLKNALHSLASASIAPNPGDLRIDVGLHHGKGRIAVSDDGVGIPHEQQQRIFEPFYSTQPGAGNGLGLTFCKNVVEAAHGRISLHSEPSMGAVFMIDLPLSSGTP